jgi:cytochrome c oxidase subunit 2
MFSGASNFSADVDKTFIYIIGIAFFFLIGITTIMIVFVVRYNRKKHPNAIQIKEKPVLEIVWTVVPVIIVLSMFFYGYLAFIPTRHIPKDAIPVKVVAKMWDWTFDYGKGKIIKDTLVVPLGKAVRLDMTSRDVIHSLYIPAFRIKEDVVPGRTTNMWFIAERPGTYEILCAEYCGLRHSYMEGRVRVVSENEYTLWLSQLKMTNPDKDPSGLKRIKENACTGCHSMDGSKLVGPTFKGLYGSNRTVLIQGKEFQIVADSLYIKTSIIDPNKEIVKGFKQGLMKPYGKLLKDSAINDIVDYLKTLGGK